MFTTPLCRDLGIQHPIFSAGIGAAAGPGLAAAVSNAGGCGVLGTASLPGKFVRAQIQQLKELTAKPFGVNIVLACSAEDRSNPASTSAFRSWCCSGATRRRTSLRRIGAG